MDNKYYTDIISALAERTIKRLWIVILVLVVLLVGTNIAWIVYESQFETVEADIMQETERGFNGFIFGDGDISYGDTESSHSAEDTQDWR